MHTSRLSIPALIKKIHVYLGLLSFSILLVYGIAGLLATLEPPPAGRPRPGVSARFEDFTVPPNLTDKQVADLVYERLRLPLTGPVPNYALKRDSANNLTFSFYTVNGIHTLTVLEQESRLRVETHRNSIWRYFDNLHTTTLGDAAPDLRVRLWAYYNEFAIWTLIALSLSGVYLWSASRPRLRAAQLSLLLGGGAFVLLYALTR
jgi:hypothetical protein